MHTHRTTTDSCAACFRYLKHADLVECAQQRHLVRRIKELEATVAERVGVSMLYTAAQLQMQPAYIQFLERLADGAATRGPVRYWLCNLTFIL